MYGYLWFIVRTNTDSYVCLLLLFAIKDWLQFRPMARRNLDELYAGTCCLSRIKESSAFCTPTLWVWIERRHPTLAFR
jgi:hypothetical protein